MKYAKKQRIFRAPHTKDNFYTPISNILLQSDLDPFAKGLLSEILSHSDTYLFHPTIYHKKYGRKKVDNAISALIQSGYCQKISITKSHVEFNFYEKPKPVILRALNNTLVNFNIHSISEGVPNEHPIETAEQEEYDVPNTDSDVQMEQQWDVPVVHVINTEQINNEIINIESNTVDEADFEDEPLLLDFDTLPELRNDIGMVPRKMPSIQLENENGIERSSVDDPNNKMFTISRKELILSAFEQCYWFHQVENRIKWFEKWHRFKSSKHSPMATFTFVQLKGGFLAFIKRDIEYQNSKQGQTSEMNDQTANFNKLKRMEIDKLIEKSSVNIYKEMEQIWLEKEYSFSDLTQVIRAFESKAETEPEHIDLFEKRTIAFLNKNVNNFEAIANFILRGKPNYNIGTKLPEAEQP